MNCPEARHLPPLLQSLQWLPVTQQRKPEQRWPSRKAGITQPRAQEGHKEGLSPGASPGSSLRAGRTGVSASLSSRDTPQPEAVAHGQSVSLKENKAQATPASALEVVTSQKLLSPW